MLKNKICAKIFGIMIRISYLCTTMKEISAEERIRRFKLTCTLNDNGVERYFHNGYEYVEIGSLKWAKCNVGAEKETDSGLYFAWGDTQGYTAKQVCNGKGKKRFTWQDYKFGDMSHLLKYNNADGKRVLDLEDDAVHVNMGGSWRMPTTAEWAALGNATTSAWTDNYQSSGVKGLVLTSKTDSSKKLFFPAAGYCYYGSVFYVGSYGYYWSSSLYSSNVRYAYSMYFSSSDVYWQNVSLRFGGFPVRAVLG